MVGGVDGGAERGAIVADLLGGWIGLGWIVGLARLFFMAKGISNAYNGKMEPLPYIGTLGDNK